MQGLKYVQMHPENGAQCFAYCQNNISFGEFGGNDIYILGVVGGGVVINLELSWVNDCQPDFFYFHLSFIT